MSASGRSCDRPSWFPCVCLQANAEMVPCTPCCYCMLLMQPNNKIKSKPPKFMFIMFDTHVNLPPDASPIAVNKFYLLTLLHPSPCLTTCPQPLLHGASYHFLFQFTESPSYGSCLRLLPRLPVTSILRFIFPSVPCSRRQFLRNM